MLRFNELKQIFAGAALATGLVLGISVLTGSTAASLPLAGTLFAAFSAADYLIDRFATPYCQKNIYPKIKNALKRYNP